MEASGQPTAPTTLYFTLINLEVGWAHNGSGRFRDGQNLLPGRKTYPGSSSPQRGRSYKTPTETSKHRDCMTTTINCLQSLKISWQQK